MVIVLPQKTHVVKDLALIAEACLRRYYRIDRRQIHYLKFILEGYDGVAVMRTVDSQAGLVVIHVAPGCEFEVNAIIDSLKRQIRIETTPAPKITGLS
jgi:hypothetical protein